MARTVFVLLSLLASTWLSVVEAAAGHDVAPRTLRDGADATEAALVSEWGAESAGLQIGIACRQREPAAARTVVLVLRDVSQKRITIWGNSYFDSYEYTFSVTQSNGRPVEPRIHQSQDYNSVTVPIYYGLTLAPGDSIASKRDVSSDYVYPDDSRVTFRASRTIRRPSEVRDRPEMATLVSDTCTFGTPL